MNAQQKYKHEQIQKKAKRNLTTNSQKNAKKEEAKINLKSLKEIKFRN